MIAAWVLFRLLAQEGAFSPEPKSPEESLKSIRVAPGFRVELVAHEPDVMVLAPG